MWQVPAQAEECAPQTTQAHTKNATAVFTGLVTGSTKEPAPDGRRGVRFTHEVEVDLVFKGHVTTETVQVRTDRTPRTCSLGRLAAGTSYVFFARADGALWKATGASGTAPATDRLVGQVQRLLGKGRPPMPPEPETAVFTPVGQGEPETFTRAAAPGLAMVIIGLLGLFLARRLGSRSA